MAMIGHGQPINQATAFATNAPTAFRTITFPCDPASYALLGIEAALLRGHPLVSVTGSYTWTIADLVTRDMGLTLSSSTYALNGLTATLGAGRQLSAARGFLGVEGKPLTFHSPNHLFADPGSFSLTGLVSNLVRKARITASPTLFVSTLIIIGKAVVLDTGSATLTAITGSYLITGSPSERDLAVSVASSSYALTGINATLVKAGALISAISGIFTWRLADVVTRDTGLSCSAGSLALNGNAAQLLFQSFNLACLPGSFVLSGTSSGRDLSLGVAVGSYAISPTTTNIVRSGNFALSCAGGSYALTGVAATMVRGRRIVASLATYAETGTTTVPRAAHVIAPAIGTYALTGIVASLRNARRISAAIGSYAESGVAAAPLVVHRIAPAIVSYAVTGTSANFVRNRTLVAAVGSYVETGVAATLHPARKLVTVIGPYVINGIPVAFGLANAISIAPVSANFVITGTNASIIAAHTMVAGSASFTLNGVAAAERAARSLAIVTGTYSLSAIAAAARADHRLALSPGAYAVSGIAASAQRRLAGQLNAYALGGTDASLVASHHPQVAASSSYGISGTSVTFTYRRGLPAIFGLLTLRGVTASSIHIVPPNMGATVSPDTGQDIIGTITDPEIIGMPSDQLVA